MRTKTENILQIIGYQHMFFFFSFSLFHYSTNYVNKASIKKSIYCMKKIVRWQGDFILSNREISND